MLRRIALIILGTYQACGGALLPDACRFVPSCSEYTKEAIIRFGLLRGTFKGIKRILRCHPFSHGGYDPVE